MSRTSSSAAADTVLPPVLLFDREAAEAAAAAEAAEAERRAARKRRGSRAAGSASQAASVDDPATTSSSPPDPESHRPQEPTRSAWATAAGIRAAKRDRRRYERAEVRRFTAASRRRRRTWLISGGALLAMVLVVAGTAFSPMMALRVVTVEGAQRVAPTQIVTALSDQLGTPLPLLDLAAVRDKLSDMTLIQSYSTESHPPDTLVIRIVERDPIGAAPTDAGFDLVDSAGVVISSSPDRPAGYPVLDTPTPKALAAAGEVVRALPADLRATLDSVRAETRDDVTLQLVGGPAVVWGSADDSVIKAAVLARLMAVAPGAANYDVSSPSSPVYS
ncbi:MULTISPECIES: FtsQ-type POTRA domain-containing protein [unclassified Leifsonia]|uniref:FtsQ-type POTRA domain-containing protein n=1 Tax=unclassified Leifsonia TaxID=2663824 RepID=UPI0009EC2F30|nr:MULTISPECIES: FtsQ-type POTRA domain-containing protein [unclassified Leifsonia]